MGFAKNEQLFRMQVFFPVLSLYKFNELCIFSLGVLPSTICNLNCKHCLNFKPYIKKHETRNIEELKKDADSLFSKIDYIYLFHITGGEPFLYPQLAEFIDYIQHNYRSRIGQWEITTNSTVLPPDTLCQILAGSDIKLVVDDYSKALEQNSEKYKLLIEKLECFNVTYGVFSTNAWIDLAPFDTDFSSMSELEIGKHFDSCNPIFSEYRNGKLSLCNYASYADKAGIEVAGDDEYFDLSLLHDKNKSELLEFRLGYSAKGYTNFCKKCRGCRGNDKMVSVAEQVL
jgi:hypothetical protein